MRITTATLTGHNPAREESLPIPGSDGLTLRFRPRSKGDASKTWTWSRMVAGERPKLKLGTFPANSLDDARRWADELNQMVAKGINPERAAREAEELAQAVAQAEAARPTVGQAYDAYIENCRVRGVSTCAGKRWLIERDFMPIHRDRMLHEITKKDVRAALHAVISDIRSKNANNVRQHNRVRSEIVAFLNYAVTNEIDDLQVNVAASIPKIKETRENRTRPIRFLSPDEMAFLIMASRIIGGDAEGYILLALTGCRLREVFGAPTAEFRDGEWALPAKRVKNRTDHPLPLGPYGRSIFEARAAQEYLFPTRRAGDSKTRTSSFAALRGKVHAKMEELAGHPIDHWTAHHIRHGFRTWVRKSKIADKATAERLINHVQKSAIDELYDHDDYVDEKAAALLKWEEMLLDIIDRKTGGNVIQMVA